MHSIHRSLPSALLSCALLVVFAAQASATLIAPHALFVDHRIRSAAIFLHNPDDKPVEVSIELIYGYPRGDGDGGVKVFLEREPEAGEPSCAGWIRALPRRVILLPGQRQTVRLLARPPANLPDGEYWSRVAVTSIAVKRESESVEVAGAEGVRVGLELATRTIISLNYRKGPVTTGIDVERFGAGISSDAVTVDMNLRRLGDAAWLGRFDAVLLDSEGDEIEHWDRAIAVYDDIYRVIALPLEQPRGPGNYMLSLTWSTAREDLPPEGILPATTVVRAVPLIIMPPPGK
ncbi:hypothetical protein DRQ53_12185 [bacterium]|nr:MAG: hypothetical protein DRQ53_12185 [bacterium]